MLRCVAVSCGALQCVAVCCGVLSCGCDFETRGGAEVCCSVAVCCGVEIVAGKEAIPRCVRSVSRCVAVCCGVDASRNKRQCGCVLQCMAVCCRMLWCVTVRYKRRFAIGKVYI